MIRGAGGGGGRVGGGADQHQVDHLQHVAMVGGNVQHVEKAAVHVRHGCQHGNLLGDSVSPEARYFSGLESRSENSTIPHRMPTFFLDIPSGRVGAIK